MQTSRSFTYFFRFSQEEKVTNINGARLPAYYNREVVAELTAEIRELKKNQRLKY